MNEPSNLGYGSVQILRSRESVSPWRVIFSTTKICFNTWFLRCCFIYFFSIRRNYFSCWLQTWQNETATSLFVCLSCISWVDREADVLMPVYLCFKVGETIINKMIAIQQLETLPAFATTHNHTTPSTPQLTPNLT